MSGCVSTHGVRYYAPRENHPERFVYDIPRNNHMTTVWVGMLGNNTLLGLYFFHGTLNAANYLAMLDNQVIPELHRQFGQGRNGSVNRPSLDYQLGMGHLLIEV